MQIELASFRDPAGYIFYKNGQLFREINESHRNDFDHLMQSGLYSELINEGLMVPHEIVQNAPLVIKPEKLPFISYPHEWSFSQLKAAALLTLKIQQKALNYGMSLKDASVYNIQFRNGKPILIDTLSLIKRKGKLPWHAYRQFCQHFLSPLALEAYVDWRLKDLFLTHIDGIPLDLTLKLLPKRCFIKPGIFIHLYCHAKFQVKQNETNRLSPDTSESSDLSSKGLISSLESCIKSIEWKHPKTVWEDYYQDDSYSAPAFIEKGKIIENLLSQVQPKSVWDIGCNDGFYSLIARRYSQNVVSFDTDPVCIDRLYNKKSDVLPLLMNLSNPTPSFGWAEEERMSLKKRGPVELIMALAVMHHLHVTSGIPVKKMAEYFRNLCKNLIIEFIPKEDKKFKKMISLRQGDFESYSEESFLKSFLQYFEMVNRFSINDSERVIFLFKAKEFS